MVENIKAMPDVGIFAGCFLGSSVGVLNAKQRKDVFAIKLDVTKEESVLAFVKTMQTHLDANGGQLHGLVNNAGILINPGPTEWTPISTYRKMFDVNVIGTVSLTKACLPLIRKSQGRIVNVASIAGRTGLPSEPAYCASKYAVEGYSDVLRRDMLAWGVTVHIIEPGIFPNTGLYDRFQTGLDELWNNISPELQAEYGESFYQDFRTRIGKSLGLGNSDSSMVPAAYMEALFSKSPKYRYRVGKDSKYFVTGLNMTHESTQDWVLGRGMDKKGAKPIAAPDDGTVLAKARYGSDWSRTILMAFMAFMGYRAFRPRM